MVRFAIEQGLDTFTGETIWQIVEIATGTIWEHYYDAVEAQEVCDFYNDRESLDLYDEPDPGELVEWMDFDPDC